MGHSGVTLIRKRAFRTYGKEYAVIGHVGQDRAESAERRKKEEGGIDSL